MSFSAILQYKKNAIKRCAINNVSELNKSKTLNFRKVKDNLMRVNLQQIGWQIYL